MATTTNGHYYPSEEEFGDDDADILDQMKLMQESNDEIVADKVDKTVNDLINYYLKSETYTKTEVNTIIGNITQGTIQVVQELPQTGGSNVIYLVPKEGSTGDVYNEYIYINNAWELIGTTQIDLTGYATETWVNTQISDFLTQTEIETLITTALANYYTKTEMDTLIAELQQETKDLRNASYKIYTETPGEVVTLNKTSKNKFVKLDIKGNRKQTTYTGKNKFDKNNPNTLNAYFNTNTTTITQNNSTRSIYIPCEENTTYTFSRVAGARFSVGYTTEMPNSGVNAQGVITDNNATSITITTGAGAKYLIGFIYHSSYDTSITVADILNSIQIEQGSTATTYEPYCGGQPSPNPEYKQDIYAVGDNSVVNVVKCNKNLLNNLAITRTLNGITYTINADKSVKINGTATALSFLVLTNNTNNINDFTDKKFNMPANYYVKPTGITNVSYGFRDTAGKYLIGNMTGKDIGVCYINVPEGTTVNNATVYPIVATSTTTYTQHEEEVFNMPCQKPMVDVADYFNWDNEKEVHGWAKVVLDGTETWEYDSTNKYFRCNNYNFNGKTPLTGLVNLNVTQLSNYFICEKQWNVFTSSVDKNMFYPVHDSGYKLSFRNVNCTTVSEWTTWLAEHNVEVAYPLAETAIEQLPFTAEQKSVAEQIEDSTSYYEQTNVYSNDNVSPILDITAVGDQNLVIDSIDARLSLVE